MITTPATLVSVSGTWSLSRRGRRRGMLFLATAAAAWRRAPLSLINRRRNSTIITSLQIMREREMKDNYYYHYSYSSWAPWADTTTTDTPTITLMLLSVISPIPLHTHRYVSQAGPCTIMLPLSIMLFSNAPSLLLLCSRVLPIMLIYANISTTEKQILLNGCIITWCHWRELIIFLWLVLNWTQYTHSKSTFH